MSVHRYLNPFVKILYLSFRMNKGYQYYQNLHLNILCGHEWLKGLVLMLKVILMVKVIIL
jgi:hypothetical protein